MAQRTDPALRWIRCTVPPLLRALHWTWRVRCEGFEALDAERAAGRPVILACWHGRLPSVAPRFGPRYGPHVIISESRDGERITAATEPLGVVPVRGSSSRGGVRALLAALRVLERGGVLGHFVDGPRGPAGEIKAGLMLLAQRSGAAILPVYGASSRHWTARSWDRMEIPRPGSRVLYRIGTLRRIGPDLDEGALETARAALEREMREGYARADADVRAGA
jgi:lysophospholipid acyltransferase (LPLAT)-like uncharacterized protein